MAPSASGSAPASLQPNCLPFANMLLAKPENGTLFCSTERVSVQVSQMPSAVLCQSHARPRICSLRITGAPPSSRSASSFLKQCTCCRAAVFFSFTWWSIIQHNIRTDLRTHELHKRQDISGEIQDIQIVLGLGVSWHWRKERLLHSFGTIELLQWTKCSSLCMKTVTLCAKHQSASSNASKFKLEKLHPQKKL